MNTRTLGLLIVLLNCSGCASIMCSAEKTVNISSEPSGAEFEIIAPHYQDLHPPGRRLLKGPDKIIVQGMTPANVTLKRGRGYFKAGDYTIHFRKAGYEDMTMPILQGFETGWYFVGNLIIGPFSSIVGCLIVDPLTGAMWDIKDVNVSLKPSAVVETSGGVKRVTGYQGHVNPATGEIETVPVYEGEK